MSILQADPEKRWQDITEDHKSVRENLEVTIEGIATGKSCDPSAIVGPYRSGKTQLLYHTFQYAWENGVPALYTDALTLFREFRGDDSDNISKWLEGRVQNQVDDLLNGEQAEWLPNWGTKQEREKNTSKFTAQESDYCLLLVDEVEQAYTQLRQTIDEINPTDDRNPLRILLDDTEGVYQIWAFGLVSAYEFRGEADAGRFAEYRLPILGTDDIAHHLSQAGKDPQLATGIWWLARGRVGWVNKFVHECPENTNDIEEWVKNVSSYDFDATRPLDKKVFDSLDDSPEEWDLGRRAIVFLPSESFNRWKISGRQAVSINGVQKICVEAICRGAEVDFAAREIIERNTKRLAESLVPASTWTDDGEKHLPIKLLFNKRDVESFFNLLANLIISFEGRTEERGQAIELINDVDTDSFQDEWLDRTYDLHNESGGNNIWSLKPSVVETAYPPVAVNPSRLSNKSADEIELSLEKGIEVESSKQWPHVKTRVIFCPNREIFNKEALRAVESKEIQKMTILLIPEEQRNDWDLDPNQRRMESHGRLVVHSQGGKRFWDFVLQLSEYFRERGIPLPISDHRIEEAINDDGDRERRNTIHTLYEQINNSVEDILKKNVEMFIGRYSLPSEDVPIWGNESLNTDVPFWSWGGSASKPRTGLSYALVLTENGIEKREYFQSLRADLMDAYDKGYLERETEFEFKEFLNLVFTSTGYSAKTENERERYGTGTDGKHSAVNRFQNYVWDLATISSDSNEDSPKVIAKKLLNMDPISGRESIDVIDSSNFDCPQAYALVWGAMIEKAVFEGYFDINGLLVSLHENLESHKQQTEYLLNDARDKNERLEPPSPGNKVMIQTTEIEEYRRSVNSISEGINKLRAHNSKEKGVETLALTFFVIGKRYSSLIEESIELKSGLGNMSLNNVDKLKVTFSRVKEFLQEEEFMQTYDPSLQEDAIAQLENHAEEIFDFEGHAGSRYVNIDSLDELREVDAEARENLTELNNIIDLIYENQDVWADRERMRKEMVSNLERYNEVLAKEDN